MPRKPTLKVSQREYAKMLGISNELVRIAVKDGKISKGWDAKEKKIIVGLANLEWGALYLSTNVTAVLQQQPGEKSKNTDASAGGLTLNNESSYAEAKRIREIIQAQLAALDLKERKEELVRKDEVYKQLFEFGQQVRLAVTAIPDRILDQMLAAKNRADAYQLLSGEIHFHLEALTNAKLNFTPRQ